MSIFVSWCKALQLTFITWLKNWNFSIPLIRKTVRCGLKLFPKGTCDLVSCYVCVIWINYSRAPSRNLPQGTRDTRLSPLALKACGQMLCSFSTLVFAFGVSGEYPCHAIRIYSCIEFANEASECSGSTWHRSIVGQIKNNLLSSASKWKVV